MCCEWARLTSTSTASSVKVGVSDILCALADSLMSVSPECQCSLAQGGFFSRTSDGVQQYYCTNCYQKSFGTKCAACHHFVEGEVVTALGNTYHQNCFRCSRCQSVVITWRSLTPTDTFHLLKASVSDRRESNLEWQRVPLRQMPPNTSGLVTHSWGSRTQYCFATTSFHYYG